MIKKPRTRGFLVFLKELDYNRLIKLIDRMIKDDIYEEKFQKRKSKY